MKCVEKGVDWIIKKWNEVPPAMPDTNPNDLLVLAQVFSTTCKTKLTAYNLDIDEAQVLIKTVGEFMLDKGRINARGSEILVRQRHSRLLKEEMETLQHMLLDLSMIIGPDDSGLIKALFLTGSYHAMAGITALPGAFESAEPNAKPENGESKDHQAKYHMLSELAEKNSWVRAGIILARMLKPNEPRVDYWIPKNTVYWENLFNEVTNPG
jgi:hypothetical protein